MTTKFSMIRDVNGYNGFGLYNSDRKYEVLLTSGGGEVTLTIPGDNPKGYLMIITPEPGAVVWVAYNATATGGTSPAPTTTDSELNPIGRYVKPGDVIHLLTTDTSVQVGIVLYALQ